MSRFWKYKSDVPVVCGHTGWCYTVEYYSESCTYIDLEQLRADGERIAERREGWSTFSRPMWSKLGFLMRFYRLRTLYIHFRRRKEIADLYNRAYRQFSAEADEESSLRAKAN